MSHETGRRDRTLLLLLILLITGIVLNTVTIFEVLLVCRVTAMLDYSIPGNVSVVTHMVNMVGDAVIVNVVGTSLKYVAEFMQIQFTLLDFVSHLFFSYFKL